MTKTGLLLTVLLLGSTTGVEGQAAPGALPTWHASLPGATGNQRWGWDRAPVVWRQDRTDKRSHMGTGLLVGGIIGVAATTVFLVGFCDDPDTECGVDEVGRALLIIAVPTAALGALIGSLIHS